MVAVVPMEAEVSTHMLMDRRRARSSELCRRAARGVVRAWPSLPWEGPLLSMRSERSALGHSGEALSNRTVPASVAGRCVLCGHAKTISLPLIQVNIKVQK